MVFANGGAVTASLLFAIICLLLCTPVASWAQAQEENIVLPQSGILYPGGYDPNTVGDIKGRVQRIVIPEKGPVQFQVRSGRETYTVLASPLWHWKDVQKDIAEGTDVRVRGSKALGTDGNLYLIAQEIRNLNTSRSIEFRDEEGYPSWAGPKASAGKAGFGSPMRGGGSLRGPGGIGRGRR